MEKLFIKKDDKVLPVEPDQIEKYHLTAGTISPFSGSHVVDQNGGEKKPQKEKYSLEESQEDTPEGIIFTTSESLDIARGADWYL